LPFDLRQKRVLTDRSAPDAPERAADRRILQAALRSAIGAVLVEQGVAARIKYPCRLSMTYQVESQSGVLRDYALQIRFENLRATPLNDWQVHVEIPTPLLNNAASHVGFVRERSNDSVTLIPFTHQSHSGALHPGDSKLMTMSYHMNQRLFDCRSQLFAQVVSAPASADGEVAAEQLKKTVSEMQCF
jgi:hypothetical protein